MQGRHDIQLLVLPTYPPYPTPSKHAPSASCVPFVCLWLPLMSHTSIMGIAMAENTAQLTTAGTCPAWAKLQAHHSRKHRVQAA